jgi:hypothetical protein
VGFHGRFDVRQPIPDTEDRQGQNTRDCDDEVFAQPGHPTFDVGTKLHARRRSRSTSLCGLFTPKILAKPVSEFVNQFHVERPV